MTARDIDAPDPYDGVTRRPDGLCVSKSDPYTAHQFRDPRDLAGRSHK